MAIVGYGGGFYVGSTPTKVAEIASWSLDTDAEDIDVTSFDSNGWRERIQGIKEWSGSAEGNFMPNDTNGQAALINAWLNGEKIKVELQVNQNIKFTGEVYVTLSIETPVDDKANFSVDFLGTGPLTPVLGGGS